ncbi:MAG: ABC transporter [bacterium]|nr:ABC transporter [bacterium]
MELPMRSDWNWPGARWWRCDFHLHSPASGAEFADSQTVTAADWVAAARAAELDAVAVTDHNCGGEFMAQIQEAARQPGRPLVVFPGVELTVQGIHLLFLFSPDRSRDAVVGLLAECGIPDTQQGKQEACASCSAVEAMAEAAELGAICIAAHADGEKGLLRVIDPGEQLKQIVTSDHLHGIEIRDPESDLVRYVDNSTDGYRRRLGALPQLTFSDAHGVDQIGRQMTWIKMTQPSMEGLRLALREGALSVRNAWQPTADANAYADLAVEEIEIREARYMGRSRHNHEAPFKVGLNPWLNTIIGGRGTGKSSLIEFLRIAMRRENEVPEALAGEFEKFTTIPAHRRAAGLLTERTKIVITYRKSGTRFRLQWDQEGNLPPLVEQQDGGWQAGEGEVAQRFPIRIYSQKQIFELAGNPEALLGIVDDAKEVRYADWKQRWQEEETRFMALRAEAREIAVGLGEEPHIRGELADVKRKLAVFEEAGHAAILLAFQRRRRQQQTLKKWEEDLRKIGEDLRAAASEVIPEELDASPFDPADEVDGGLLATAREVSAQLVRIQESVSSLATEADAVVSRWRQEEATSKWRTAVDDAVRDHDALVARLRESGVGEPSEYGALVQQRHNLEDRLRTLDEKRQALEGVETQIAERLERLRHLRRELSLRRNRFLTQTLGSNPHVRIAVLPYAGASGTVEDELRELLGIERQAFQKDIGDDQTANGLLGELYHGYFSGLDEAGDEAARKRVVEQFENRLQQLKDRVGAISREDTSDPYVRDKRFADRLKDLPPERLDRLACWFPPDSLKISYSPARDGRHFKPIEQGSPGQKTAALLTFLLSYGNEPMVLDQPEDDLDNQLIYDLIVKQLREMKLRRQVLVVTHNANIVVNGDAELVISFDSAGGQTRVSAGGLQEQSVRDEVCRILEGGREAFTQRYRRIGTGDDDV